MKLQAMRVIVLDEIPMISAELMGKLERSCRKCERGEDYTCFWLEIFGNTSL